MANPTQTTNEEKIDQVTSLLPKEDETLKSEEKDPTPSSEKDKAGEDKPEVPEKKPDDTQLEVDPEKEKQPEVDHKKKFRESSSEANRLLSVARTQHEIIKTFTTEDNVTEEDMKQIYEDYDEMSPAEQNRWKRLEMETRRNNRILAEQKKRELSEAKDKAITLLITSNPLLEKNAEEFKKFIALPENDLVDASTLAKSFLYDLQDQDPVLPSETIPKRDEPTMERGSASRGEKPQLPNQEKKPEEMNDDELADLMIRNPKSYMDHVQKMAKGKKR